MHNYHSGGASHEIWAPDCRYALICMKIFIWLVCVFNTSIYHETLLTLQLLSTYRTPTDRVDHVCVIFSSLLIICFDKFRNTVYSNTNTDLAKIKAVTISVSIFNHRPDLFSFLFWPCCPVCFRAGCCSGKCWLLLFGLWCPVHYL